MNDTKRLCAVVLLTIGICEPKQLSDVDLSASKTRVAAGQTSDLIWNASGASSVVIAGFGSRPSVGTLAFKPAGNQTILLIAKFPSHYTLKTVSVLVAGGEGDEDDFQQTLSLFRYPVESNVNQDFGSAIDLVKRRLFEKFGFITRYIDYSDKQVRMETNRWRTPSLQKDLPKTFAERRISYLLEVLPPSRSKSTTVTIRSFIESRRLLEETWYPETDTGVYLEQSKQVRNIIEN